MIDGIEDPCIARQRKHLFYQDLQNYYLLLGHVQRLSDEQRQELLVKVFDLKTAMDSRVISTRYGADMYLSIADKVREGELGIGSVVFDRRRSLSKQVNQAKEYHEFFRFIDSLKDISYDGAEKLWRSMGVVGVLDSVRSDVRNRFCHCLQDYVRLAESAKSKECAGQKDANLYFVLSGIERKFGLSAAELPAHGDRMASLQGQFSSAVCAIAKSYLPLVIKIAKRCMPAKEVMENVQEGNLALVRGILRYDYRFCQNFILYAEKFIKNEILEKAGDRMSVVSSKKKMRMSSAKLQRIRLRDPSLVYCSDEEIAAASGLDVDVIVRARNAERFFSIDSLDDLCGEGRVIETIPDEEGLNPEEVAAQREMKRLIERAVDLLDEKGKVVIGKGYLEGLSHSEIGALLGCTRQNVWLISQRARQRLIKKLNQLNAWSERTASTRD